MTSWIASLKARLDVVLCAASGQSRVLAGKVIKAGGVTVNGRIVRKSAHMVERGAEITVAEQGAVVSDIHITPADLSLFVLFEDDACMVIDKPAGLSVHPGAGIPKSTPTLLHGIAFLFKERHLSFGASHILVHRLDKETTGCLLVGKTHDAHRALQQQFALRTVEKRYLALVAGVPSPPAAMIDASIGRSAHDRTKMSVLGATKSRDARTTYRTLASCGDAALLCCELHTGRTHQIRVHLASVGHPILGDGAYASAQSDDLSRHWGICTPCLHAWKLTFASVAEGKVHTIEAPLPHTLIDACRGLGIKVDEKGLIT